jgi:outer membrane protein assembly factor BamB
VAESQRRDELARLWRTAQPVPVPLLPAEQAWTLRLSVPPSAPGAMDDRRIYIPLRQDLLVALERDTGVLAWTRTIDTQSAPVVADGTIYLVSRQAVRALDAETGEDRWITPLDTGLLAPLVWDSGWLLAVVEPDEVMALRAADGHVVWRQPLGAPTSHPPVPGGDGALYFSLADGTVVALALADGSRRWEQRLPGMLSEPAVAADRVYVGSTDNFFYAFHDRSGELEWKWRGGGDVIGAAVDEDVVYFASLDNVIRAVNRGNGNQRWQVSTGTRPVLPPRAFGGIVVLPGLSPAVTVFVARTGAVMGTYTTPGELLGVPLIDPRPQPFGVAVVTMTREGVVEALRPTALLFREAAVTPWTELPGRPLPREPNP